MVAMCRLGRQPGGYAPTWDFLGFRLDLKPFLPKDMLYLLTTYHSAFSTQQHTDATIAIAWMSPGQGHDALMKLLLVGGHRPGKVVIGRTRHLHITTGPSHRTYALSNDMHYGRFFVRRAYHFFALTSLRPRFSNIDSASIFFSSAFSFSNALSRLASANSISPYFFFHR